MRALWTQRLVNYEGRWHTITDAGIKPLPVQRPIPIWFGGRAEPVLRRIARMGDGWFPQFRPDEGGRAILGRLHTYTREAGRDPADIGINGSVQLAGRTPDEWIENAGAWKDLGVTHLSVSTRGGGLSFPEGHIDAIQGFRKAVDQSAVTGPT